MGEREEGKERELGLIFKIKILFLKNKIIKRNKKNGMPVHLLVHTIIVHIHVIETWN